MRAQNIVKGIKQYQEKWVQHIQRMDTTGYLNKHYNINQKDEDTQGDRGRDGGTNFILRIYKEQEPNLILPEHDDDDDDEEMFTYYVYFLLQSDVHEISSQLRTRMTHHGATLDLAEGCSDNEVCQETRQSDGRITDDGRA